METFDKQPQLKNIEYREDMSMKELTDALNKNQELALTRMQAYVNDATERIIEHFDSKFEKINAIESDLQKISTHFDIK